jgi:hypothetical protein
MDAAEKVLIQTTNLGGRSSNLFGRATSVLLSGRCLCYAGAESPPLFKAGWRLQGAAGWSGEMHQQFQSRAKHCEYPTQLAIGAVRCSCNVFETTDIVREINASGELRVSLAQIATYKKEH